MYPCTYVCMCLCIYHLCNISYLSLSIIYLSIIYLYHSSIHASIHISSIYPSIFLCLYLSPLSIDWHVPLDPHSILTLRALSCHTWPSSEPAWKMAPVVLTSPKDLQRWNVRSEFYLSSYIRRCCGTHEKIVRLQERGVWHFHWIHFCLKILVVFLLWIRSRVQIIRWKRLIRTEQSWRMCFFKIPFSCPLCSDVAG